MYPRLDPVEEVWRAVGLGLRDYVRKNGFRKVLLGVSGGIDSTRRGDHRRGRAGRRERRRRSATPASTRRRAPRTTPPSWPRTSAWTTGSSRSSRWSTRSSRPLGLTGVAEENLQARVRASSGWASPTRRAHSSSPTPTRARCRSGTRRSTATAWAGSPRSRTCPRPWCGSSPAGATGMRRRAASRPRFRRRRSPSRRRPSCGRARPTRTRCRPTRSSTRSSPATSGCAHGRERLIADGFDPATVDKVIQLVDRAEWKRRQFAPGPKISPLAFGKDRRLPITSRWREEGEDRS